MTTGVERSVVQAAPWPAVLEELVRDLEYKRGWEFELHAGLDRGQGSAGTTLIITITTPNSYAPDQTRRVAHYMLVPPAAYDARSWRRWLLEQILLVERHEACEFFTIAGEKPYAPHHGPGNDPYIVFDHGTDEDVRTSYLGDVKSS
jgi:hypothetical protein